MAWGWLKKRLEGAAAQLNPFDNGRTYDTVVNRKKPGYRQQEARKEGKPVAPSYGGGFTGLVNRARDVVDANTPQDRFVRQQLNQPLNYYDQQKQFNEQSLKAPEQRSTIEQIIKNAAGALGETLAKTPGAVADFKGSFDKTQFGKLNQYANPMNAGSNIINIGKDLLADKPIGTEFQRQATDLQKFGRGSQDLVENKVQQSSYGNRETDNKYIAGASRAVGQLGGQVLTSVATGGTSLPAFLMGTRTFSDEQKAAKEAGLNDSQSFRVGVGQGIVEGALEKVGLDKLKGANGNLLFRSGKRFLTEGTQEGTQQLASNIIANKTYDPSRGFTEGVKESALFGGIAGGVAGSAFDINPKQVQQNNQQLANNQVGAIGKNVNDPLESLKQEARKYKSAEEFVNSREKLYHGSNKSIDQLKPGEAKGNYGESQIPGIYTTPDQRFAQWFAEKNGVQVNRPKELYSALKKPLEGDNINQIAKTLGVDASDTQKIADTAKAKGYDGIVLNKQTSYKNGDVKEVIPFDTTSLLTKQQLTDIYNQAISAPQVSKTGKGLIIKETKPQPDGTKIVKRRIKDKDGKVQVVEQRVDKNTDQPVDQTEIDKRIADAMDLTQEQIDSRPTPDDTNLPEQSELLGTRTQEEVEQGVKEKQGEPVNTFEQLDKKYLDIPDVDTSTSRRGDGKFGTIRQNRDAVKKANVLRLVEKASDKGLRLAGEKGGIIGNKVRRIAQYIASKQAGQNPEVLKAAKRMQGDKAYGDMATVQLAEKAYNLIPDTKSLVKVHSVLDPDSLQDEVSVDQDGMVDVFKPEKVKYSDLTPQEQQAADMLRDIGDTINDTSYRNGDITRKQWEYNRGGKYLARLYSDVIQSQDVGKALGVDFGMYTGMFKSRKKMNAEMREKLIRDPVKIAAIRGRQVRHNEALRNYMVSAEQNGYVSDKPKTGYTKVEDGKTWYNWADKYVDQSVYENAKGFKAMGEGVQAMSNLLDLYDKFPPRRFRKKLLTIYNPVVRTGNVTSNYFFAYLNGVNPVTFQKNKVWASKNLNKNDPLVVAAVKAGLLKNDTVVGDKNIFNKNKAFLSDLDQANSLLRRARDIPKNADKKLVRRYQNADDIAKLAALKAHVDRGHSIDQAIEMTSRGFQDYSRVGHGYDLFAKSPVFGNAFARFQGDLWMNILKNDAVDHPVRVASLPIAIAALGQGLSALSGEDEEDKKTREERPGSPTIPFTKELNKALFGEDRNISLEMQLPTIKTIKGEEKKASGALDVARFTPLYLRQGLDGTKLADDLSRTLPFNVPSDLSRNELVRKGASDPLIGPLISLVGDTDWRGKSVSDPQGRDAKGNELYPDDPLSDKDKWRNRGQYAAYSYAPYPFNEVGNILAANRGDQINEQVTPKDKYKFVDNSGKDFLGREGYNTQGSRKSVGQALARLFGVRAEEFGADEAKAARDTQQYFAKKEEKDAIINSLPSETKKKYDALHSYTKKRSGDIEFDNDPRYSMKRANEWLSDPKLVEAERKIAELEHKNGKPLHPKWTLNDKQLKAVLTGQTFPPGEGTDTKVEQLYETDWYDNYKKQENQYYDKLSAWNKKQGYDEFKPKYKYPEGTPQLQKLANNYYDLESGTGEKTDMLEANPQLAILLADRKEYTNKKRKDLGLPVQDNYYADVVAFHGWSDKKYLGQGNTDYDGPGKGYSKYGKKGRKGRKGGGRKGSKGLKFAVSTAFAPDAPKGIKLAGLNAPAVKLQVPRANAVRGKKAPIRMAKQAKTIKKVKV